MDSSCSDKERVALGRPNDPLAYLRRQAVGTEQALHDAGALLLGERLEANVDAPGLTAERRA